MKRFKKFYAVAIASLLLTSTVLSGCGSSSKTVSTDTLKVAMTKDPGTVDVQKTTDDYGVPLNIYSRLVETVTENGKSKQVPSVAQSWKVSSDGLVYTFTLRKDVKFSNGDTLTADDVVYTFDRMLDPKTKALNTDFVDMIKGADDRMNGKADSTVGLKAVDANTLEITLDKPFGPFIANLATPPCSIYDKKATIAAGDKFGIDPAKTVGSGAFKLKAWKTNSSIEMVANDKYFGGKPTLAGVTYTIVANPQTERMLFETGKLDVFDCDDATSQIPYFQSNSKWKNQIVSGPRMGVDYYCLNENIKPFDNVKVRQAFQLAIDRKTLIDKLYNGKGSIANGIMPVGLLGYDSSMPKMTYNKEKAKQLLTEAGYPNGFDMEIDQVTDSASTLKLNEAVQAMLADVGIKVKINQMDESAYYATRKQGKLSAYESNWSADYNDPDNFIYTFFSAKNTVARSYNYKNQDVFDKLENARKMTNQTDRVKLYQEIQKTIVNDDAAFIPLFQLQHLFVVQPKVKNFKVSWNGWSNMQYNGITLEAK